MSNNSVSGASVPGKIHSLASEHLPYFIPAADGSDQMMTNVLIALVIIIVIVGSLYLHLHSIPERLAHGKEVAHFELVAVLGLVALFTHNNIFWVAALVLAFIRFPDFSTPLVSIASSLKAIAAAGKQPVAAENAPVMSSENASADGAAVVDDQSVEPQTDPATAAPSAAVEKEGKN